MEKFTVHTGTAAPLRRSDIDTDQIIPGRFCATHSRVGYADGLFGDWRKDPDFVLNRAAYQGVTILVAGENFGCGSSREHAVWALQNFGFRVVIAPRFADIFRANSLMAGLLTVTLSQEKVNQLWSLIEAEPDTQVTVDLEEMSVRAAGLLEAFTLNEDTRARMLAGLDQIAVSLRFEEQITEYERRRRRRLPTSAGR
ncbi:MAG: 3-isopropylmalate dehydratase small subunit [Jatrophihabitantaceae bacterium]